jgi:hypothetical protein
MKVLLHLLIGIASTVEAQTGYDVLAEGQRMLAQTPAKREHSRGSLLGEHFLRHEAGKNVRSTPQGLIEKQQPDAALECERAAS